MLERPLALACGATLSNRIAKSAMSEQLADRRSAPTIALEKLYTRWATSGCGLLITGNVMVDRTALGEPGNVAVEDERDLDRLRAWARAAGSGGAQVWMQINHPGRQAPRYLAPRPVAPSAIGLRGMGPAFAVPRALTVEEIQEIVARFARTAVIAEKAGFTGVQIHGAHGYLVNQFLSPLANIRTDEYGGSISNRMRFLLEIVRAVRGAVGAGFGVGIKLNSADFQRGGFTEEESMEVVRAIGDEKIDLLEISGGTYEQTAMWDGVPKSASTRAREAYFLEYAEKVRSIARMPLMVTGGFRTAAGMREAIAGGAVDVIGMARPLAAEPTLPARILSGESASARIIRLATGNKTIDSVLEGAWYQRQISRMGRGLDTDPDAGRWSALAIVLFTIVRSMTLALTAR